MNSFRSNTLDNRWGASAQDVPSGAMWDTDDTPTGPIYPIEELSGLVEPPVDDPNFRRVRRNPWLVFVVVLVIAFLVFLGIGITGHRVLTGSWGLPWVREYPPLPSSISVSEAPSAPASPSVTPQVPPTQAAPTGPVAQGIPTHIVIHHGDTMLVNTDIAGVYDCPAEGSTLTPQGDKPYWLSCSSQVGDGMTIPAVILGHTENGNPDMPFGTLGLVQSGDTIEVTVPTGTVTFQADEPQKPQKAEMGFGPENDVVKLISCDQIGNLNVVVSGHRTS